jgi:uncharacterized protein (TIGR02421 family)
MDSIRRRLEAGGGVRRRLPDGGTIHIDRLLPFLCLYRQPPRRPDAGTEQLVTGQASFLVTSGAARSRGMIDELLRTVSELARDEFGEFLVIEVWAGSSVDTALDEAEVPRFCVHATESEELATTVRALRDALGPIRVGPKAATVRQAKRAATHPPGIRPPVGEPCRWIGIEVAPIWRRGDEDFPIILRRLRRGFSRAVQRACYRFTRDHTPHRPKHYHALGRRAWVKAAAQVDERIAAISESFDFLLLMTPTNSNAAFAAFRAAGFRARPRFLYRHLPIDPIRVKRALYEARIENVEDPTLDDLFRRTQLELDLQLSALMERPSRNVMLLCRQIYGDVEPALLEEAQGILHAIPPRARERDPKQIVGAAEFAAAAEREVNAYREQDPGFASRVVIRDDIASLMVSRGDLLVSNRTRVPRARVCALLQHEVGTHVVTYRNGCHQQLRQIRYGLPGYEELQEGLAVLAEYLCGALSRPRLRILAARVVAVHAMIEGASFVETFGLLHERWSISAEAAFGIAMRVHRGGGISKDAAYLRGLRSVVDHLGEGGDIEPLLVGKISLEHLPLIEELRRRGVVKPPLVRPRFLDLPGSSERLDRLRPGLPLLDLTREDSR